MAMGHQFRKKNIYGDIQPFPNWCVQVSPMFYPNVPTKDRLNSSLKGSMVRRESDEQLGSTLFPDAHWVLVKIYQDLPNHNAGDGNLHGASRLPTI